MPTLIDAHCHLDFAVFDEDRDQVLARARQAGVEQWIVAATTRARWSEVLDVSRRHGGHPCLGLHPVFLDEHCLSGQDNDLDALAQTLEASSEVVALGECGIDARYPEQLERQWSLFDAQLRLARKHQLPVVVHCVRANDEVAARLRQFDLPEGGLIHAFSGSSQQAMRFHQLGYVLGLGGAVTYPRATRLRRAVAALPDSGFVLETDSPDMPLAGYQGQRNEPARVAEVCRVVAELRGQSCADVAEASSANARRLFGLS
ncbi:TatD family hydrolase [Halomonas huangheensis]|uniref:TatD family hydrolase n=1 Tax=Halomonas huangheensis TaxID=1178482 RepID=W1NBD3_9GAMM|nr:TatD family hydrolase [Halomonas huangheensis]ALM52651.1 hydrolase TatD [Halomonas huangheensis]ERL52829.1 hypothetical protein BJB45_16250 [Halomonas huangheensis]